MEITQQVRDYAAKLADPTSGPHPEEPGTASAKPGVSKEEIEQGMAEIRAKFRALGGEVYVKEE